MAYVIGREVLVAISGFGLEHSIASDIFVLEFIECHGSNPLDTAPN